MTYARRSVRRAVLRSKRRSAVQDQFRRGLLAERLEERSLLAADFGFHSDFWNVQRPTDVNADSVVAPNDALIIINSLNSSGSRALPQGQAAEGEAGPRLYLDVDNDGYVSPNDALMVINELNGEGEDEPLVSYIIDTVNASGQAITTVRAGQDFFVRMRVQDLRPAAVPPEPPQRGVYAAYTDLLYSKSLSTIAVAEIQTLTLPATGSGSFTLTLPGGTPTAPINFNTDDLTGVGANIQTALNAVLPSPVTVLEDPLNPGIYQIKFSGLADINNDKPLLQSSLGTVTIVESVKPDPTLSSSIIASAITFSPNYPNGQSAADGSNPDRIDEMGAFTNQATLGRGVVEVLRVRMLAKLPDGVSQTTATFTPDFSNLISPASDTLLINRNGAVPFTQVISTAATITINSGPINAIPDTASVNEDDPAGVTINVIQNDTRNDGGAVSELQLVPGQTFTANGGTVTAVNTTSVRFVPNANFNGTATFTYQVQIQGNNNVDDRATGTVTVTVNAVNDAPVVTVPGAQAGQEDVNLTINGVSVVDVDANDAAVNPGLQMTLTATNGTVSLSGTTGLTFSAGDGTSDATMTFTGLVNDVNAALAGLTFRGNQDFSGAASLVITANDQGNTGSGGALQDTKTVAINLAAVNDAPVNRLADNPIQGVSSEDQLTTPGVDLAFNATNSNAITVTDVDAAAGTIQTTLSLADSGQGTLQVAAAPGATITGNNTSSVTISGTLTAVNAALAGLVYSPAVGFVSNATLTISTNDNGNTGSGGAQITTSQITIKLDPGVRPFAVIDRLTIPEGTTAVQTIDVLANDFVEPGRTTTITAVTQPPAGFGGASQGSVAIVGNQIEYTPPGGDFFTPTTPVRFTYTIEDGVGDPSTGTVSINITNVPDAPVAQNDNGTNVLPGGARYTAVFADGVGQPLVVAANQGVLVNDSTVDNNFGATVATLTAHLVTGPTKGTLTLNADGSFTYTPTSFTAGNPSDTFTYRARSSLDNLESNIATVTIHVTTPPQAANFAVTGNEDSPLTITLNGNFTDPAEQLPLGSVEIVTNVPPATGTVVVAADGKSFTYNPAQDFNTTRPPTSPITFTYLAKATDLRPSNVATISITVNEVNDNPTAQNVTGTGIKRNGPIGVDQPVEVPLDGIAPDVSETLKVTVLNGVTADAQGNIAPQPTTKGGSVRLSNFQILYTSPTTETQPGDPDTFTYRLSDFDATTGTARGGLSAAATVSMNIIEFVPKSIEGFVFLDKNGNGVQDPGESPLGGVTVHLTGTDFLDQPVSLTAVTDATGKYVFPQVPGQPGVVDTNPNNAVKPPKDGTSYTITQDQPRYLISGSSLDTQNSPLATPGTSNSFLLVWDLFDSSTEIKGLNFTERGVDTSNSNGDPNGQLTNANGFITELLYTSSQEGFILALTVGQPTPTWSLGLGTSWGGTDKIEATLDPSLTKLTLKVFDGANEYTKVLYQDPSLNGGTNGVPAGSMARFRILATGANGQYIVRIDATPTQCGLPQLVAAAPAGGGEGEGEAGFDRDYSHAADAVFAEHAWA